MPTVRILRVFRPFKTNESTAITCGRDTNLLEAKGHPVIDYRPTFSLGSVSISGRAIDSNAVSHPRLALNIGVTFRPLRCCAGRPSPWHRETV